MFYKDKNKAVAEVLECCVVPEHDSIEVIDFINFMTPIGKLWVYNENNTGIVIKGDEGFLHTSVSDVILNLPDGSWGACSQEDFHIHYEVVNPEVNKTEEEVELANKIFNFITEYTDEGIVSHIESLRDIVVDRITTGDI